MAGNRKVFEEAIRTAADLAWDGHWDQAIDAYQSALEEFPDDTDALTGLGMAYSSVGKPKEALDAYRQASDLAPEDPVLLENVAKALEKLGRTEEACNAYLACGRRYISQQRTPDLAVACWSKAARVHPESVAAHISLLKVFQRQGRIAQAVDECLALARIHNDQGRNEDALQFCKHALKLSPRSPDALALLDRLRYGGESPEAATTEEEPPTVQAGQPQPSELELVDAESLSFAATAADEGLEQRGSPVESTRRKALTDLAQSVFEQQDATLTRAQRLRKEAIDSLVSKAIDLQTRGSMEKAIAAYREVLETGAERPAVHFNLGLLYQEKLSFREAIAHLQQAVTHPDYRLGSHFALGECHRARGRIEEALAHFIQVLKIVDLATVEREHADDLIDLYEHVADGYLAKGDHDQALEFANSLVTFLNEQGWEDKVRLARERLDALTQEGPVVSLAEALTVPDSERILASIAMSQEYIKRGMHYTAMEECYLALESAANYLPIHRQLARVSLAMGNVDRAVRKLVIIADTYLVRGTARQAASMYQQALRLAPMDTAVRTKLINLLISHGEIDQALKNYMILADSFYHLAQMDRAQEVYHEALRLAPRVDGEREWSVRILYKIADIHMQRVDWRRAVSIYEQIRDLAPRDEQARLMLMELLFRLDQPGEAVKELDDLQQIYEEEESSERLLDVLEDAGYRWPEAIPLRARLAQAYLDAGHTEQAVQHLDKLGHMQLSAGQETQARATMRAIIALRPPNTDHYESLLQRISDD